MSIMNSISDAFSGAANSVSQFASDAYDYAGQKINEVGDAAGINSEKDIAERDKRKAMEQQLAEMETQMASLTTEIEGYAEADLDDDEAMGLLSDAQGAYDDLAAKKKSLEAELNKGVSGGSVKPASRPTPQQAHIGQASNSINVGNTAGADIFGVGIPMSSLSGTLSGTKPTQQIELLKKQGQAFGGFKF